MNLLSTFFLTLGVAGAAGIFPLISVELYLLAAAALLPSTWWSALVIPAVLGQLAGRSLLYFGGRGVVRLPAAKLTRALDLLETRLRGRPIFGSAVILMSAASSIPPFSLTCIAAGAMRHRYALFLVASGVGMAGRYCLVVLAPRLFIS